ncbi:hypothetical protein KAU34_03870, partial [candidate division WOR-3 bacterium]|nr:hypothetical protein [candidate division WOR-3 bacterium]
MNHYRKIILLWIVIVVGLVLWYGKANAHRYENSKGIEWQKAQRKKVLESIKEKFGDLSVDSLIGMVENALVFARKRETLGIRTDEDVRWITIEAVSIVLREKGDRKAIPILEELAGELIFKIGSNHPGYAQAEAAKSVVLLLLPPKHESMTNIERIDALFQYIDKNDSLSDSLKMRVRRRGARLLLDDVEMDSSATLLLCSYLDNRSRDVRYRAVRLLEKNLTSEVYECLKAHIDDSDISVRCNIIRVISQFPNRQEEVFSINKTIFKDRDNPERIRERALRS